MSYPIEVRLASKNGWHTPDEARRFYGRYSREGATIHWWGDPKLNPDSAHDKIVNYILGKAQAGTGSVNYVASNNKITLLVNPDNVAWASQSGNPTTISVEFSPNLNDEGYKKAGWLINELEGRYGHALRLYPHNHWTVTQCPGSLSLTRMRAEADKWKLGGYNPKPIPVPIPTPTPVPAPASNIVWTKWQEGPAVYVFNKDTSLWNFNSTTWNMEAVKPFKKGEYFTVYGQATNTKLKATYYVTEYSFNKKVTNGVNPADLDLYVPPVPVTPTPPPAQEPAPLPPNPPSPVGPTIEERVSVLEKLVKSINDFLNKIFNRG